MSEQYFSESEAAEKIGKSVRSLRDFSDIPTGTTGTVLRSYKHSNGEIGIDIQWNLPGRRTPLIDGFSKDEYNQFLVEVT